MSMGRHLLTSISRTRCCKYLLFWQCMGYCFCISPPPCDVFVHGQLKHWIKNGQQECYMPNNWLPLRCLGQCMNQWRGFFCWILAFRQAFIYYQSFANCVSSQLILLSNSFSYQVLCTAIFCNEIANFSYRNGGEYNPVVKALNDN